MLDRLATERGASNAQALAAKERERHRIAQELHDEIGQSLTAVLLGLKRTVDRAPDDLRDELRTVQETIRASLDEVRQVARRLRPGVLEDLGLLSAMNALAADFSQASGIPITRRLDQRLPTLGSDVELEYANAPSSSAPISPSAATGGGTEVRLVVPINAGRRQAEVEPDKTRLLADDHGLVRRGLRLILAGEPDLVVVAEAGDGAEAVELSSRGEVDQCTTTSSTSSKRSKPAPPATCPSRPSPRDILQKLGIRDRLDLTRFDIRAGLVEP